MKELIAIFLNVKRQEINTKDLEKLSEKCGVNLIYESFTVIDIIIIDKNTECYLKDSESECSMVEPEKIKFTGLQKHSCNINGIFNFELIFYFKKNKVMMVVFIQFFIQKIKRV